MRFVRAITVFVWLPLLWAAQVCMMLRLPAAAPLLKLVWRMTGKADVGVMALSAVRGRAGLAAARALADEWIRDQPRGEIAAAAGMMAVEDADLDAAQECLRQGLACGDDRSGMLDVLEALLPAVRNDAEAAAQVARRLARRRDLSPAASRFVLGRLLWDDLLAGRLAEARDRGEHILAVSDDPQASVAMWALELSNGRQIEAAAHLRRAAGLNETSRLYYQVLGLASVGRTGEARGLVAELEQYDSKLAAQAAGVIRGKEAQA